MTTNQLIAMLFPLGTTAGAIATAFLAKWIWVDRPRRREADEARRVLATPEIPISDLNQDPVQASVTRWLLSRESKLSKDLKVADEIIQEILREIEQTPRQLPERLRP